MQQIFGLAISVSLAKMSFITASSITRMIKNLKFKKYEIFQKPYDFLPIPTIKYYRT